MRPADGASHCGSGVHIASREDRCANCLPIIFWCSQKTVQTPEHTWDDKRRNPLPIVEKICRRAARNCRRRFLGWKLEPVRKLKDMLGKVFVEPSHPFAELPNRGCCVNLAGSGC